MGTILTRWVEKTGFMVLCLVLKDVGCSFLCSPLHSLHNNALLSRREEGRTEEAGGRKLHLEKKQALLQTGLEWTVLDFLQTEKREGR